MDVGILPAWCLCTTYMQYPRRPKEAMGSSGAGVTDSREFMWVLGTEPESSRKTAGVLNCWAVFPTPQIQILKRGIQIKAFVIHLPVCVAGVECWPMDSAVWKNMKHCLKVRSLCLRLHQPVCWPMWFQWSPCAYWCLPAYQPLLGVKCIISLWVFIFSPAPPYICDPSFPATGAWTSDCVSF